MTHMIYGRTLSNINSYIIYQYDHASDTFSNLTTPNYQTTEMETSSQSFVTIGNRVYFWASGTKEFLYFSSDTNDFTYIPELSGADMQGSCMAHVGALIYVIGGINTSSQKLRTFHFIDGVTTSESMPFGRRYHGCKAYNGKIYVFAGFDTVNSVQSQEIWELDPSTGINSWRKLNTQFPHQFPSAMSVVFNGGIVLISSNWIEPYIFDPVGEQLWKSANQLPYAGLASGPLVVYDDINDQIVLFSREMYSFGKVVTTAEPTSNPTKVPTKLPSSNPTKYPTQDPITNEPSSDPTKYPSQYPSSSNPSMMPTKVPSIQPSSLTPTKQDENIIATNDNSISTTTKGDESGINDASSTTDVDSTSVTVESEIFLIFGLDENVITIYIIASVAGLCCCAGVLCTAVIGCFCVQREKNKNKAMVVTATSPRSMSVDSDNEVFNEGPDGITTEMTSMKNEKNKNIVVKVTEKDDEDSMDGGSLPETSVKDTNDENEEDRLDAMYRQPSTQTPQN